MRRKNATWLLALGLLLALAAFPGFMGQAHAATVDTTVRWNIPVDTSFTVTFAPTHTRIDFDPSSGTFTDLAATDQTDSVPAYNITNTGNVNINVSANFTGDFPTGVTEFRTSTASVSGAPSGAQFFWTDANETTQVQVVFDLTPGSSEDLFAFTTGTLVVPGVSDRTYRLISSAA